MGHRAVRHRQPDEGRSRTGHPVRQPHARSRRDDGAGAGRRLPLMAVTDPGGFVAAGTHCGIKADGAPDLSLVATADGKPVTAAAVFTSNLATAAPVQVTRRHLEATGGRAAAVVLNSGNANAATGEAGRDDAERMCVQVATGLGCDATDVLVCSTGLIGIPLPMALIEAGIPGLVAGRAADGGARAAEAILTTDTVRKEVVVDGAGF